jgi:hypothetical protein
VPNYRADPDIREVLDQDMPLRWVERDIQADVLAIRAMKTAES